MTKPNNNTSVCMPLDSAGIDIAYSDKHLVLVNKSSGLLSVPGRGPDKQDCVLTRVQRTYPTARIVHRLDCATSGLMVLALDADTHRELSRQFHDREIGKQYVAVVAGEPVEDEGEVDAPLMTDWPNRPRQKVDTAGKPALTHYRVVERAGDRSRVALTPVTGRSHQLRVHMLVLGHPILGDEFYAPAGVIVQSERLLLHAERLRFTHPQSQQAMEFYHAAEF